MFKKFTAFLLAFFVLISGIAIAQENLYVNAAKHYSIQFPSNWVQRPNDNGGFDVMYMSPPTGLEGISQASVSVITSTIPPGSSLNNFVDLNMGQLRSMPGFNMNNIGDALVQGVEVKIVDYNYQDQYGHPQSVRQYFMIYGRTAYLITMSASTDAYGDYAPAFTSILGTFRFI